MYIFILILIFIVLLGPTTHQISGGKKYHYRQKYNHSNRPKDNNSNSNTTSIPEISELANITICNKFVSQIAQLLPEAIYPKCKTHPSFNMSLIYTNNKLYTMNRYCIDNTINIHIFFECKIVNNDIEYVGNLQYSANNQMSNIYLFENKGEVYMYDNKLKIIKDIDTTETVDVRASLMDKYKYSNSSICARQDIPYKNNWSHYKTDSVGFHFVFCEGAQMYKIAVPFTHKINCSKELIARFPGALPTALEFGPAAIRHPTAADSYLFVITHKLPNPSSADDSPPPIYDFIKRANDNIFTRPNFGRYFHNMHTLCFVLYNTKTNDIKLSDTYLPLPKTDTIYALFHPMSINYISNKYIVSGGYGNHYNLLLNFDTIDCPYSVGDFANNKYKCFLIE